MAGGRRSGRVYIYHITPCDNLPAILAAGGLMSDRQMRAGRPHTTIGYSHIKQRRLATTVPCYPGQTVGDFVPFYFCPRSVMLYVIHCRNPELAYRGGQSEVVHLVSAVDLAVDAGLSCVYTESNAGAAGYVRFRTDLDQIETALDWPAIRATDFQDRAVKDGKQAEFLVYDYFPFACFRTVGVQNPEVAERVTALLAGVPDPPSVQVRPAWYF